VERSFLKLKWSSLFFVVERLFIEVEWSNYKLRGLFIGE